MHSYESGKKHKTEIEEDFSFPSSEIGVHSYQKSAHTKLNCGSTDGPAAAAACIRGGHSLGTVRNVYVAQEKASDYYFGRILGGLPVNAPEFAVSYPDFIPIDVERSVTERVSVRDFEKKQREVDGMVHEALASIFGKEKLANFPTIRNFLHVGLASHLKHIEDIEDLLPQNSKIRDTPLFTNPLVSKLEQHVRIAMPWDDHYKYFKIEATGLPAHVTILAEMRGVERNLDDLPKKLEQMLETRQMNGPVTLAQMRIMVNDNKRMKNIEENISLLTSIVKEGQFAGSQTDEITGGLGRKYEMFDHQDGLKRRVPPNWHFPKLLMQHMYIQWHCGNGVKKVSPIKNWDKIDVEGLPGKRIKVTLSEIRRMMSCIDNHAKASGKPPKKMMMQVEANTCFEVGFHGINVPTTTPTGRPRHVDRLTWQSALQYMPKVRDKTNRRGR